MEGNIKPGSISDLPAAIAPSNGTNNFRGGTFGCTRTMEYPVYGERRKFCVRCNNCTPLPNNPKKTGRYHNGLDISLPFGTPIKAIYGGSISTGFDKDLGNYVIISSTVGSQKITLTYAHLEAGSINTSLKTIKKGQFFAKTGNTGNISTIDDIESKTKQQHCHLIVKVNGEKVNPKPFMWPAMQIIISKYD